MAVGVIRRDTLAALAILTVTSALSSPLAAEVSPSAADIQPRSNNTLDSQTTSSAPCTADSPLELARAQLYAEQGVISSEQPGLLIGEFRAPPNQTCDLLVLISFQIPHSVYMENVSRQGVPTITFGLPGNSTSRTIRSEVYGSSQGDVIITGSITYWPVGHPDRKRVHSEFTIKLHVAETVQPWASTQSEQSGSITDSWPKLIDFIIRIAADNISLIIGLLAVVTSLLILIDRKRQS